MPLSPSLRRPLAPSSWRTSSSCGRSTGQPWGRSCLEQDISPQTVTMTTPTQQLEPQMSTTNVSLNGLISFKLEKVGTFHLFIIICFHWIKWKFNFNCLLPIVSQDMPPLLAEPVGLTMAASASASAETRQAKTRQDAKTKLNVKWKYFYTKIFLQT